MYVSKDAFPPVPRLYRRFLASATCETVNSSKSWPCSSACNMPHITIFWSLMLLLSRLCHRTDALLFFCTPSALSCYECAVGTVCLRELKMVVKYEMSSFHSSKGSCQDGSVPRAAFLQHCKSLLGLSSHRICDAFDGRTCRAQLVLARRAAA